MTAHPFGRRPLADHRRTPARLRAPLLVLAAVAAGLCIVLATVLVDRLPPAVAVLLLLVGVPIWLVVLMLGDRRR